MNKNTLLCFLVLMLGASCAVATAGAIYLAYHGKDGWGWMIFLALTLGGYVRALPGSDE